MTTGAHSFRDHDPTETTGRAPRHLRTKNQAAGRRLRKVKGVPLAAVAVAVVFGVVGYVAASLGSSPSRPPKRAAGTTHPHTSSSVSNSSPSTTSPPVSSTATTRPTASTTTVAPTTTTPTTTTPPSTSTTIAANLVPTSDVLVEVLNGVGTPQVADQAARALHNLGFSINGVGNAANFDHRRNLIEYGPGSYAAAQTVAAHVTGVPQYREYHALQRDEVWVTLGATYDGVSP